MNRTGISEYDTRSTNGQKQRPDTHVPGRSLRIFRSQPPRENWPVCKRLAAKKMHVKDGPNNNCPQKAL